MPGLREILATACCDALGALAADTADRAGAALGVLAWRLGFRRRVVNANLARTLGLRGPARARVARRSYATMGANFMALWTLGRPDGPETGVTWLNPLSLRAQQARHGGMVFLTLHLGAWEVAAYAGRDPDARVHAYAKAQHAPILDRLINRQRARVGVEVLLAHHGERTAAVSALRGLRSGRSVGLMADQKPKSDEGVPAFLLGVPTLCHRGPAFFARRAGAAIIPGFCLRVAAGRYRFFAGRAVRCDALPEAGLVQLGMDQLSAMIAAFPGQYFWHHRRFKQPLDGLAPRASEPWRTRGLRLLVDPLPLPD